MPPNEKRKRTRKRSWLLAFFVLALSAPPLLVQTRWGRERVRDLAIAAMYDQFGLRASLSEVEVRLVPFEVSAHAIVLDDPAYGRFAEAEGLSIRPSFGALLRGQVDLERVSIDAPTVHLIVRDGEIRNLPRARSEGSGELPFRQVLVRNAQIAVDAAPLASARLEGVNLSLDVENGTELHIAFDTTRGLVEHTLGTERIQHFKGELDVTPDAIDIGTLQLWTPYVKIGGDDIHLPLPFREGYEGSARVRLNVAHLQQLPIGGDLPDLGGTLDVAGRFWGTREGLHAEALVRLEGGARIEKYGLGDAELEVALSPTEIAIRNGTVALIEGGGNVEVSGAIQLEDDLPMSLDVQIADLEFEKLMKQLGVTPDTIVSWHIDGGTRLRGTLSPFRLGGPIRLQTRDFLVTQDAWHAENRRRVIGVEEARITGRVSVRPDALRFERLTVDLPNARLLGNVHIGFDNALGVEATSENLDLADATPLVTFPIGGTGRMRVDVGGTFSDPTLTASLDLTDFSFDTFPVGHVVAEGRLEKNALAVRLPHIAVDKGESHYTVDDFLLDFSEGDVLIEGSLETEHLALADFFHTFHYDEDERYDAYAGLVTGRADLRYTLGFPGDSPTGTMVTDFDLEIPEAEIEGYAFTDGSARGRFRWINPDRGYRGAEVTLEHVDLRKGDGTINLQGTLGLGGALAMTVVADQLQIHRTEGLAERFPDLNGVIGLVGEIGGTAEVPRVHLDVGITGLSYRANLLGDVRAYVRLTDREDPWIAAAAAWNPDSPPAGERCAMARAGFQQSRWPADPPVRTRDGPEPALLRPMAYVVCAEGLDGALHTDLAIGRTKVYPLRGEIRIADLDLSPFLPNQPGDEPVSGAVSGRALFRDGAMLEPATLSGRLNLSDLWVGQRGVVLNNAGEVAVVFDRGAFQVEHARFAGPSSRLTISGGGSVRHGLSTTLDGEINLGLLATLSPRVTAAQGRVGLRVTIGGPFDEPTIYGEAAVTDAGFRFASFEQPIDNLGGRITFSAHRILFENFHAEMAGGDLDVSGRSTIEGVGIGDYQFDIRARGLSLVTDPGVEITLGGSTRLEWERSMPLPRLAGTIRLERVAYSRPIQLDLTLGRLAREDRAEVERYDPGEDQLEFDLRIVEHTPLRVDNNLINAEVRIEDDERPFRIIGTDQRVGAIGTLTIPHGVVYFRNKEFEIRRGVVEFDDPDRVDPNFDVRAVTDIHRGGDLSAPRWRLSLRAHGNRDSFRIDASSDPELSQEDVMLLLVAGMTRGEAEELQAGDLTSSLALEALVAVSGIGSEVRDRVAVDDLSVTSVYSTSTHRTEPHVSVGKRIADRLRMTASTSISESREFRTGVEWNFSDQTSVEVGYDNINTTTSSTIGNVGGNLRWRLEFE